MLGSDGCSGGIGGILRSLCGLCLLGSAGGGGIGRALCVGGGSGGSRLLNGSSSSCSGDLCLQEGIADLCELGSGSGGIGSIRRLLSRNLCLLTGDSRLGGSGRGGLTVRTTDITSRSRAGLVRRGLCLLGSGCGGIGGGLCLVGSDLSLLDTGSRLLDNNSGGRLGALGLLDGVGGLRLLGGGSGGISSIRRLLDGGLCLLTGDSRLGSGGRGCLTIRITDITSRSRTGLVSCRLCLLGGGSGGVGGSSGLGGSGRCLGSDGRGGLHGLRLVDRRRLGDDQCGTGHGSGGAGLLEGGRLGLDGLGCRRLGSNSIGSTGSVGSSLHGGGCILCIGGGLRRDGVGSTGSVGCRLYGCGCILCVLGRLIGNSCLGVSRTASVSRTGSVGVGSTGSVGGLLCACGLCIGCVLGG